MIPTRLTLDEIQVWARYVQGQLESLLARNVDMNQRRVVNAGISVGPFDYVTRLELDKVTGALAPIAETVTTGLLNAATLVRSGPFSTRGAATAHINELFEATDQSYVGWISTGSIWRYAYGVNAVTQAGLAAVTALLTANDTGYLFNVTDFTHSLRWTGSATEFAPGDSGSLYFADFPSTPTGGTWGLCDGTAYTYLKADGTTGSYTTKNLTGHYRKSVTAAADATAAAVAPGFSGTSGAEAAHTHAVTSPTGTPSATVAVQSGAGTTVATDTHTHSVTSPTGAGSSHTHGAGTYAVDATGEPAAFKVLTYVRR